MLKFFLVDVPAAVTQVSFSDGLVVSFHVICYLHSHVSHALLGSLHEFLK